MSVSFDTELLSDGDSFFINKCWRQFGGFLFACDKTVEWEWANKIVRWENVCLPNTCVRPDFVIVPRFEQDNEFHHFRPLQIRRLSCHPECLDVCVFTTVHKNLISIWHVGLHNKETKPRFFSPVSHPHLCTNHYGIKRLYSIYEFSLSDHVQQEQEFYHGLISSCQHGHYQSHPRIRN